MRLRFFAHSLPNLFSTCLTHRTAIQKTYANIYESFTRRVENAIQINDGNG